MGSLPCPPPESFVFRSKLPDIKIPDDLTIQDFCFEKLSQVADHPCVIYGPSGRVYTYAEVELTARRFAAGLHRAGVRRGGVVMLLLHNSPEFVFALLGSFLAGATVTTSNPLCTSPEIVKQIRAAGVNLVVTHSSNLEKITVADVTIVCTDSAAEGRLHFSELASEVEQTQGEEAGADDVAELLYSSGTTGFPKGVMLSHRSVVASITQQIEGENPNLWYRRDDVLLCALPLFHTYGLNTILLAGLRAGAALVIMPRFELAAMMELVQRHRITVAPVVPPIILALSKSPMVKLYDLSSIRMLKYGAAPISKSLEDAVHAMLPAAILGQGYGMTEAGVLSMSLGFAKNPYKTKQGSCGTVVRNAEIKIVDPLSGSPLPRNEAGEICVRGPQIMKGYLNDEEATARTIDTEGWLHTGDIGYVDGDDEIFIVDRLKEIIKYKGFQVAPAELEALLLSHPAIADAAVIPMKEDEAGEVPVAFVVRSDGWEATEEEIKRFVSHQVVFYKRIRKVFFADVIPKSPSGKIMRKGFREKLASVYQAEA